MAKHTNYASGPRGINLKSGGTHWLEPGDSVELSDEEISGPLPDLGSAGAADLAGIKLADMNRSQLETTMRAELDFADASDDDIRKAIQKVRDAKANEGVSNVDLSILDATVADLPGKLAELDLDHLVALRQAEADGQARKGALAAIDDAIAAKQAS